jgi:hypothetical protein
MVRAIIGGSKTQTRRVACFATEADRIVWVDEAATVTSKRYTGWVRELDSAPLHIGLRCPYGAPGDRLWVRESCTLADLEREHVLYRADLTDEQLAEEADARKLAPKLAKAHRWTPGIHMPRWASRITLEITEVRVERLQSISTLDAMAEGAEPRPVATGAPSYTHGFRVLWDSINGGRPGCSWADNPWLWRIGFKRIEAGA